MANKQTAVEWLKDNLKINGIGAASTFPELFEQAKAMEKEQIIEAKVAGYEDAHNFGSTPPEQYYEETYGK